jgi:hypothetical protein
MIPGMRVTANQIGWAVIGAAVIYALYAWLLAGTAKADEPPRLADSLLGMMMRTAHPGWSPHSFEALDECGTDEHSPTCDVTKPMCDAPVVVCRAPVYLGGAWRRVERVEAARARFAVIAAAIADESEDVFAKSKGKAWPGGSAADFAVAMLAASYWSTGLREDIESGRKRGPAQEACLADLQPMVAWSFAPFPHANLSAEQVAQKLLGTDYESLRRCYGTGLRALSSMRRWADAHCRYQITPSYAGFSAYATGSKCQTTGGKYGDVAMLREKLYQKFRQQLGGL